MAGVHFDAVEAGAATKVNGLPEILHDLVDVLDGHLAGEGRRIEVETARRGERFAPAGGAVRHVAAMADLDGGFRTLRVDGVRQLLQLRHNLLAQPQLPVEGESAPAHRRVSHRGHADAATGHRHVIVEQGFRRRVVHRHVFKCRRTYRSVSQCYRPNLTGRENGRFDHC